MAKGMFSQGVAVLCNRAPSIDDVKRALGNFVIAAERPASDHWAFSGPSVVVPFRPDVNGYISVDIVDRAWPDEMGNPKTDAILFGAWSMGHFGPFTFPGGLERAVQHAWSWRGAATAAEHHRAFVRIRSNYLFGADGDAKVLPEDYDAAAELLHVTRIAAALLRLKNALCYFNPNGEVLQPTSVVDELLQRYDKSSLLPLELWANLRFFNLGDNWFAMDCAGMAQLDIRDHEAVFPQKYNPQEIDHFIRNAANYVAQNGEIIKNGDTMDGPADIRWRAFDSDESMTAPPRSTLRWFPQDGSTPPEETRPHVAS